MKESMVLRKKELKNLIKEQDSEEIVPGEILPIKDIIAQCRATAKLPSLRFGGGRTVMQVWKQIASFQRTGLPQGLDMTVKRNYLDKIKQDIKDEEPVKIVIDTFPFKDPNPLVTNRIAPDFGELLFVQRLLQINEAVKTKYPLGVEITVLAEGEVYRRWLGVSETNVKYYMKGIKYE